MNPIMTTCSSSCLARNLGSFECTIDWLGNGISLPKFCFCLLPAKGRITPMKIATIIARVLLGLIFVVFGSNAFLHFLPMPPLPQGLVGLYLKAFFESGYVYVIAA